jgi:hypothetical protein
MRNSRLSLSLLAMSVAGEGSILARRDEYSQYMTTFNPILSGSIVLNRPSKISFVASITGSEKPVDSLAIFLLQIQENGTNLVSLVEVQSGKSCLIRE